MKACSYCIGLIGEGPASGLPHFENTLYTQGLPLTVFGFDCKTWACVSCSGYQDLIARLPEMTAVAPGVASRGDAT